MDAISRLKNSDFFKKSQMIAEKENKELGLKKPEPTINTSEYTSYNPDSDRIPSIDMISDDKISNSKLPSSIKKTLMERKKNLNENFNHEYTKEDVDKALLDKEIKENKDKQKNNTSKSKGKNEKIKELLREVIDEILDEKLEEFFRKKFS